MNGNKKLENIINIMVLIEILVALTSLIAMIWLPFLMSLKMLLTDIVFFIFTLFIYYFGIYAPQKEEEKRTEEINQRTYVHIPRKIRSEFTEKLEKIKEENISTIKFKSNNNTEN